jgi:ABC-2 type transport system permease protein
MLLAALSLTEREIVRFCRQPSRVVGALAPPLLFWFLIGSGIGDTYRLDPTMHARSSLEFLFPGTLLLIMLFTAIFSTISIVEDRREGFLQSVLVAPGARGGLVLGKILGGTTLALAQAFLVLVVAMLVRKSWSLGSFLWSALVLFVTGFGFTGLGFLLAWQLDSTQGFHALMNLLLMPMWILSGALFPATGAPGWLRAVMAVNPMSHALEALRHALAAGSVRLESGSLLASIARPLALSVSFALATLAASLWLASRSRAGDLS